MNSMDNKIQQKCDEKNNTACNCGCLSNSDEIITVESKNKTINPNN